MNDRATVLLGAAVLASVGRDRFQHAAQHGRGLVGRAARAFCEGHAGHVGAHFDRWREDKDAARSVRTRLPYADETLAGYGAASFGRDQPITQQQRGLVLPFIERLLAAGGITSVVEIGAANGHVLLHLARRHPRVRFLGIDLSTAEAERACVAPNLRWLQGYALDLARAGHLACDLLFASSTFCLTTPREWHLFRARLLAARRLVIQDPVLGHYRHGVTRGSWYMDSAMWFHDYAGDLAAAGWRVEHVEQPRFPLPTNPRAEVGIVVARRA